MKGRWTYLYRAVDSRGQTIDFLLSAKRDAAAAKRFFRKALGQPHTGNPRTITVDKNAAYPAAVTAMKRKGELWRFSRLRQVKYLNNIVEQDHRRIKRLVRPGLGFGSLQTACRTLAGFEGLAMIRKGQARNVNRGDCGLRPPSLRACSGLRPDLNTAAALSQLAPNFATDPALSLLLEGIKFGRCSLASMWHNQLLNTGAGWWELSDPVRPCRPSPG